MKKIYSLLLIFTLVFACKAGVLEPIYGMEFIPGAKESLQKNVSEINSKISEGVDLLATRSYTDPNGNVWYSQLLNFGPNWYKYFKFGEDMAKWEDLPYYEVVAVSYCNQDNGVTLNWYQSVLFWPSKYALGLSEDATLEGAEPATIDEVISSKYRGLFRTMEAGQTGLYDSRALGMINNKWFGTECIFAGYIGFIDKGSRFQLSNYDKESSSIGMKWTGTWTEEGTETTSGPFALNFEGEAFITGFESLILSGDFTELHILDFGEVNWSTYPGVLYEVDFEPVKLYRIMAHNAAAEIQYEENPAVQPATFALNPGYEVEDLTYLFASAYADLNAVNPYGEYRVQELDAEASTGYVNNKPLAGTMLPGGYNYEFSRYDGTLINYKGNTYNIIAESVLSVAEDQFVFDGVDMYGNKWQINFPACYIHSDMTDYSKCEEFLSGIESLFGNKTVNVITKSSNSINVTAAENCSVSIYSSDGSLVKMIDAVGGEKVSIELAKGMYIVRVGAETRKVIM